jgi:hypothetical protein
MLLKVQILTLAPFRQAGAGRPVPGEHARVDTELPGHERHRVGRRGRDVVRAEPQYPKPAQLQRPAQAVVVATTVVYLGHVGVAQREEAVQGFGIEPGRKPRQALPLGTREDPQRHPSETTTTTAAMFARLLALVFVPLMLLPDSGRWESRSHPPGPRPGGAWRRGRPPPICRGLRWWSRSPRPGRGRRLPIGRCGRRQWRASRPSGPIDELNTPFREKTVDRGGGGPGRSPQGIAVHVNRPPIGHHELVPVKCQRVRTVGLLCLLTGAGAPRRR